MLNEENCFDSFTNAYLQIIDDILIYGKPVAGVRDPNSIGSGFGTEIASTKEILVYTFVINNPRSRSLHITGRNINKAYLLANFMWTLMGTQKGKSIVAFNQKGIILLNQRKEINSAIGPHIFKMRNDNFYEFDKIEMLLRNDPTTRRAVLQFLDKKDLNSTNNDVPCFNHMQFFIREAKLVAHVVMRSQNALMVLPYDFYLFSMLHEALSVRLNISLGKLYYSSNSLHIYEDEIDFAKTIKQKNKNIECNNMANFSKETIKKLKRVFIVLSSIYQNRKFASIKKVIYNSGLDDYWKNLLIEHFEIERIE